MKRNWIFGIAVSLLYLAVLAFTQHGDDVAQKAECVKWKH
jgi:hypothetical protein